MFQIWHTNACKSLLSIHRIQFSERDAEAYFHYEKFLGQIREVINPLLDGPLPDPFTGKRAERTRTMSQIKDIMKVPMAWRLRMLPIIVPLHIAMCKCFLWRATLYMINISDRLPCNHVCDKYSDGLPENIS